MIEISRRAYKAEPNIQNAQRYLVDLLRVGISIPSPISSIIFNNSRPFTFGMATYYDRPQELGQQEEQHRIQFFNTWDNEDFNRNVLLRLLKLLWVKILSDEKIVNELQDLKKVSVLERRGSRRSRRNAILLFNGFIADINKSFSLLLSGNPPRAEIEKLQDKLNHYCYYLALEVGELPEKYNEIEDKHIFISVLRNISNGLAYLMTICYPFMEIEHEDAYFYDIYQEDPMAFGGAYHLGDLYEHVSARFEERNTKAALSNLCPLYYETLFLLCVLNHERKFFFGPFNGRNIDRQLDLYRKERKKIKPVCSEICLSEFWQDFRDVLTYTIVDSTL